MQANPRRKAASPTITEQARRTQIIDAAIATIGELGFPKASFAQIAKRAGLSSTGLISYHFRNKQDLNDAIVAEVFDRLSRHMHAAMQDTPDPVTALRRYIEGLIGFMQVDGPAMQALVGIFMHGAFAYTGDTEREATSPIMNLLRWGQAEGVFRDFDVMVMATTIQRSLDGIPLAQSANPDLDLDSYARELVELFDRATRKDG